MRLKELIKNTNYRHLENFTDREIKGISCHSQKITPGDLFVAIKGERADGHSYISQAIHKGATAVILQKDLPLEKKVAKILVPESRVALALAAGAFFGYPAKKLKIIGVTGTCGKTTVTYLLEKILSETGEKCGVIGTVNYRFGQKQYPAINTTPSADVLQSFFQEIVLAQSKYAIMEISSHAIAQHRVDGIDFSAAIFTNLTPEHLDYHRNIANYFAAKASLFKNLSPQAYAIINSDDVWGRRLRKDVHTQVLTYGLNRDARIRAKALKLGITGSRFSVVTPGGEIEVETALIGRHNVYNILAACACAFIEKIDFACISSGIKKLNGVPGRLQRVDCLEVFPVFIDYAHTDDALEKALLALRETGKSRIITVFGCGGDRDKTKRPRMGKVATQLSDFVIITCDNPRSEDPQLIVHDIIKGIPKKNTAYQVILDRYQAIKQALALAEKDSDIVLIAGKGHESVQIFADKTVHFNDREAVEDILKEQCLLSKKY